MDWINQSRYTKWFIVILIVINVVTITMMWISLAKSHQPPPFDKMDHPPNSMTIMQKELNLTKEQSDLFEKMRKDNFDKAKEIMIQFDALKEGLSEELIKDKRDTSKVNSIIREIGAKQSELERLRFDHFEKLISLCTPEQKEKLKPILKNIISGNPGSKMGNPKPGFRGDNPPDMPMDGGKPGPPGEHRGDM